MVIDPHAIDLRLILAVGILVLLGASEVGFRLGKRAFARGTDRASSLEGPIIGILALLLGFTFSMALERYEARRGEALVEANAIGTTALRARLLPAPHNKEVRVLLREYVGIRAEMATGRLTEAQLAAALARSSAIHESLWLQAKAVAAKDSGMVPTGLFIQTLNDMIDSQEKRLSALHNRLPPIVLFALYGVGIVAVSFAGYTAGLEEKQSRRPLFVAAFLIAGMITLIQDIDRPQSGFVKVSQQPIFNTAAGLAGDPD